MKALVVDDVPLMRKVIAAKLTKLGVDKVYTTGNPTKGISDFRNESGIKLIIADYRMPVINGTDFFKEIYTSKLEKLNGIKTVLMSGIEDLEYIEKNDGLEIDYYLSKTDLIEKLEEITKEAEEHSLNNSCSSYITRDDFQELLGSSYEISLQDDQLLFEFDSQTVAIKVPQKIQLNEKSCNE